MSITTDHLADVPHPARAIYFAEWDAGVSDPKPLLPRLNARH